jgi:hypothetical protein
MRNVVGMSNKYKSDQQVAVAIKKYERHGKEFRGRRNLSYRTVDEMTEWS